MKRKLFQRRMYYVIFATCAALYIALTLFGPRGPNTFNLSGGQIKLIQLTFVIPILLIWAAAIYGAFQFRAYAESIKKSPDGQALMKVSQGLLILAFGLIVTSLFGTLRQTMLNLGNDAVFSIISRYLAVIFALLAFYFLFQGSNKLREIKHIANPSGLSRLIALGVLILVSIVYVYALLNTPYRNSTPNPQLYRSYYLPDWLIVVSIIAPYILSWVWGVLAAVNIWSYKVHSKGTIYRRALTNLVLGILAITFFSILLQLFTTLATSLENLGLRSILILIYVIIFLYAIGFLYIASGAKKLAKIEEA
jgi:hypothetical protein